MSVKKFGPFILERMIGRGGMGAVYRARNEETGQIVAVKALLLPLERERERFEAEISTLRLLRHENIVKLYGFGQENGILYYAMEFVDGPSLATLLRRGRRFSWEETAYIGMQICNALKHAHDRGVIHRDIKPANIMLMNGGRVKVSDYGIAQYFGASRLTNANQVVGTIEFMAPEQAQAGAVTPKTDIYSLGALMYALLTSRPPYVAKSLPELLQKYKEGYPELIRTVRPETPKVFDEVVRDLLQIPIDERPGDARIVGRRLEAILYTSPTCQNGNPFVNSQFQRGEEVLSSGVVSSSRVDLENDVDSTMMRKDFENDFRAEDEAVDIIQDFPYRPISDDPEDNVPIESPFDKTTERATSPDLNRQAPRPEEDDFVVGEEVDRAAAALSDSETSTCQRRRVEEDEGEVPDVNRTSETVEATHAAHSVDADSAPLSSESSNVINPTVVDLTPDKRQKNGASSSTEFDVFDLDSGNAVVEAALASKETASSVVGGLLNSKSSALSMDSPTRRANAKDGKDAPSESEPSKGSSTDSSIKGAASVHRSATTVVDKPLRNPDALKQVKPIEPIAPSGAIVPSRNVSFEELDEAEGEIEATPVEKFRKSSFTAVKEDQLGKLPETDDLVETSIFARFRIIWTVLVFAAVVACCSTAFRPPSANSLYSKIDRAFSRSTTRRFDSTLRRSERDMKRFVELYPNDPRTTKVNYFLCELQIDELDQRLERQAFGTSRDAPLQPIVRAYLEARRAAQRDWDEGSKKLAAFIELFGSKNILDGLNEADDDDSTSSGDGGKETGHPSLRGLIVQNRWKLWNGETAPVMSLPDQLVVIAKRRLIALEAEVKTTRRADLALLNDRLITAESLEEENPERAAEIRQAAEELYGLYDWARPALDSPGSLDETDEPDDDSSD